VDLIATPTALNLASNPATTPGVVSRMVPASGVGRKLSPKRKPKPSPKTRKSPSGSGSNLPEVDGVEFENHSAGGKEAWHVPPDAVHRKDKTYLGHVGKRLLATWGSLDPDARQKAVEGWVAMKREKKGIQ
jgi:hypothetical protein